LDLKNFGGRHYPFGGILEREKEKLHMQKLFLAGWVCPVFLAASAQTPRPTDSTHFALHSGDTVVFYGDSITAQNLYTQDIELYTATRFPGSHIHFFNSGVGGDKVSGGYGGTADVRLARDVAAYKPTMVTIMLGMNDGAYTANSSPIEQAYERGYKHLLDSVRSQVPGVRFTLLGPSALDDVTRPAWFAGGYNGVLEHYAGLDQEMAKTFDAQFTNLNPPVVALLQRAQALDPLLAQQLIPDRVHPSATVHWVMAEAVLKGWNAPALVSSVTVHAKHARLVESDNASVTGFAEDKDVLSWSETEYALPLPFNLDNAADALLLRLSDIEQKLNDEELRVKDLQAGSYRMIIDDQTVGTFTAAQFQDGINLAIYKTPMRDQAQAVSYKVSDHIDLRRMELHLEIVGADAATLNGVRKYEADAENSVYEAAKPVPHHYRLVRIYADPNPS
jgi:lysophospholipase L1-like esterase